MMRKFLEPIWLYIKNPITLLTIGLGVLITLIVQGFADGHTDMAMILIAVLVVYVPVTVSAFFEFMIHVHDAVLQNHGEESNDCI